MKTRVLAIVPYAGMKEIFLGLAASRSDIALTVEVADLEHGVKVAQRRAPEGYDVLISRGGTAQLLRMNTDMPVIEISITVFDVLQAIKSAEGINGKMAIVGYPSLTHCATGLCQMMQYDVKIATLSHDTDVSETLLHLLDEGYSIFVGDTISYTVASQLGLTAILVLSSTESVSMVLDQALLLSRTFQYTQRQREMLKAIFAESGQDIFVFYDDKRLWFSTMSAENEQDLLKEIAPHLDEFVQNEHHVVERQVGAILHVFRSRHIEISQNCYTMVIHETRELYILDDADEANAFVTVDDRYGAIEKLIGPFESQGLRAELFTFAQTNLTNLLVGESGTGKSQLASLIHKNGKSRDKHFYIIDCASLKAKRWHHLLSHEDSPLCDAGASIFFRNAEAVSDENGGELLEYILQSTLLETNKLLFSINTDKKPNSVYFLEKLRGDLPCIDFPVPPLRERASDLPSIATVYLNKLNLTLGKNIIGFEKDALDQLMKYTWPENYAQLSRVIRKLAAQTTAPYVSTDTVHAVLRGETPAGGRAADGYATVDIRRPLSEIDYDIIRLALQMNDMNQTETANQLQISRSKLWRVLK